MALDRISVSSAGTAANSESFNPDLSADGRYVVYESWAGNLDARDADGGRDIFLYDRQLDKVELISTGAGNVSGNGTSRNASVSADGRYVVFQSDADNILTGDTAPGQPSTGQDIFLYDRQTATMTRVSANVSGGEGNGNSAAATISDDGRYVAFESMASDLVVGDTNGVKDIFVWDRITGTTKRISVDSTGAQVALASKEASISGDGLSVVFTSSADLTGTDDTPADQDIFIVNHLTNSIELIGDGGSSGALSYDGQSVAFLSNNRLTAEPDGLNPQVFLYDRAVDAMMLVSASPTGDPSDGTIDGVPAISGDGRFVTFTSGSDNLAGRITAVSELFVFDRDSSALTAMTYAATAGVSSVPDRAAISHDGSLIAFSSKDELVAGYAVDGADVFVVAPDASNTRATISLANTLSTIDENTSTAAPNKVADIIVTDDGFGFNALALTGRDASSFVLAGRELFLKAGVKLDHEKLADLRVSVSVDDAGIGGAPDHSVPLVLQVANVNEKPTSIGLSAASVVTQLSEGEDVSAGVFIGDIIVEDDTLGSNVLSIGGPEAAFFEIRGSSLYLKTAVSLNFETKSYYNISITANDATIPSGASVTTSYMLEVLDANEAPLNPTLSASTVREARPAGTVIGTFAVSDPDANDTFTYSLLDSAGGRFAIVDNELHVADGLLLDYEQTASHTILVRVSDSGGLSVTKSFTVNVADIGQENVTGDADANVLRGGVFADTFKGGGGNDTLTGAGGNDLLDGGTGSDWLSGGAGNDTYVVDELSDIVNETVTDVLLGGTDTVVSSISWVLGASAVERLTLTGTAASGAGNDLANYIIGNAAANALDGLNGNDTLFGGAGSDTITGGVGNDFISGGSGRDVVSGGAGADRFVFELASVMGKTAATRDVIKDFTHGSTRALSDQIDLSAIDANGTATGNGAFAFLAVAGAAFSGIKGQVRWYQANSSNNALDKTFVEGDINGDRIADFQIELSGLKVLVASDFML